MAVCVYSTEWNKIPLKCHKIIVIVLNGGVFGSHHVCNNFGAKEQEGAFPVTLLLLAKEQMWANCKHKSCVLPFLVDD